MDVNPDADLAWRELIPRVRFHSRRNIERHGANTLPLIGPRQAKWHLSKGAVNKWMMVSSVLLEKRLETKSGRR